MPQPGPAPHRRAVQGHGFAADMHLAQGPVRPWARRQAIVQEQFPVSRRQVGQGDALDAEFLISLDDLQHAILIDLAFERAAKGGGDAAIETHRAFANEPHDLAERCQ